MTKIKVFKIIIKVAQLLKSNYHFLFQLKCFLSEFKNVYIQWKNVRGLWAYIEHKCVIESGDDFSTTILLF